MTVGKTSSNVRAPYKYASQTPSEQPRREELFRGDYQLNQNWRFTGRVLHNKDNRNLPYGVNWAAGTNGVDTAMVAGTFPATTGSDPPRRS